MITLLHTESAKRWGGQERRTFVEAGEFKKRGYRVILAVQPGSVLGKRAKEMGIEVREIKMSNRDIPVALFRLFSLMRKEKVDIINTHSSSDSWRASFAARWAGRPVLLNPYGSISVLKQITHLPLKFLRGNPQLLRPSFPPVRAYFVIH